MIRITTYTDSVYVIRNAGDRWFLRGENTVSATSKDIRGDEWEIERPLMPVTDQPFTAFALKSLDRNDPRRIPGGGKITSPVKTIEPI